MLIHAQRRLTATIWLSILSCGLTSIAVAAEVETLHQLDLEVKRPDPELRLTQRTIDLWLEALGRPEADLRREAALTIGLAHQRGFPNLKGTTGPLMSRL